MRSAATFVIPSLLVICPALADELQKWINIIPVRGLERCDVRSAALVHSLKIMPARPVDGFRPIDAIKHRVRHDARMPSIAIGERMNFYETMVQAGRSFRRPVSLIFSPIFRIADQRAELHGNMNGIDADVFSGLSKPARPVPDVAEQALVQG